MDTNNSSPFANFTKLNSDNYNSWKLDMKVLLIDRGSWEFVNGTAEALATDASSSLKVDYKRRKERAYTTIYQGIEKQFHALIANTLDGKEAWEILKENFEPKSRARLAGLVDEFYDLKYNQEEETIGIYCKKVSEKALLIKDAGFDIPDMLQCFQLIRKLPNDYDNLVQVLYRAEDDNFKFKEIERQLITEEGRIKQKRKDEGLDNVMNAYLTVKKTDKYHNSDMRNKTSNKNEDTYGKNQNFQKSYKNSVCNYCKRTGHIKKDCFILKRKEGDKRDDNNNGNNYNNTKSFYTEDRINIPRESHEVYMNSTKKNFEEWIIDSGATSHFCTDKMFFQNFVDLPCTEVLIGDKNAKSNVTGKGNVTFYLRENSRFIEVKLKNVLYAPNMRRNLISGACMDIAGFEIKWKNNKMEIYNELGKYFFTANRKERFYVVTAYYEKNENEIYNTSEISNAMKIHRRFCHINMNYLNIMEKNEMVRGMEKFNNEEVKCDICQISKATRSSFKPICSIRSNNILERVYMDVWGPSPVTSLGGGNYFLSIIDDYSRKTFVHIMQRKSEVFNFFEDFENEMERQYNFKIKIVHTDNGMEFCHAEFKEFLKKEGIKAERTSAYIPEQNGVAERFNRTAVEGIRSMLQDSGLQPRFWEEALHTFVHVKNLSTHKLLKIICQKKSGGGKNHQ